MNNFFEALKNQISTFCICADSFKIFFAALLWRNQKIKFWHAYMKTLSNCENPSSNPLQTACCGIQEPTYDSVNCSVSRRGFWSVLLFIKESSQWEYQKNQFAFISFGKIQFLPPRFPVQVDDWLSAFSKAELRLTTKSLWVAASLVGGGGGGGMGGGG